jgi:hypothetical protein
MFPKSRVNRLEMAIVQEPGSHSPHVVYANLEFDKSAIPKGGRRLLRYLYGLLPSYWTEKRTLGFLKEHQVEFRNCLDWLSKGSVVDYGPIENEDDESRFREGWEQEAAVKFLQQHGLDHGGVTLAPRLSDPIYPYEGLEFDQKRPRDPLDPICWYMLTLLAGYGTLFVRRCSYWKCRKFFCPRTQRKLYCSDSCRALQYALEEFEKDPKKFRKKRAKLMKKSRADRRALKEGRERVRSRKRNS